MEHPEVVPAGQPPAEGDGRREAVEHPAKLMRIGSMIRQLLEEVRGADLDEASRGRLREIYETSVTEIATSLSPDLQEELDRLALPFASGTPSGAELRVVQAQLVGWLDGLFHGIQASVYAHQMARRQQVEARRRLPAGDEPAIDSRPGTYL